MDTYETTIYTAVLITGFVLIITVCYFLVSMIRNQRKSFALQRRRLLTEVALLESDRSRIAGDLHDDLGPLVSVTKIHVDQVRPHSPEDKAHLERAAANMRVLMERMGGIARNLTPKILETKGLQVALQEFIERYGEVKPIRFQLEYGAERELPLQQALAVYRMVQEIVHNAVKHSGASFMRVQLKERGSWLYLSCRDNGSGFNAQAVAKKGKGMGLHSLHSRVLLMGGSLELITAPGQGTEYFIQLPLNQPDESTDPPGHRR